MEECVRPLTTFQKLRIFHKRIRAACLGLRMGWQKFERETRGSLKLCQPRQRLPGRGSVSGWRSGETDQSVEDPPPPSPKVAPFTTVLGRTDGANLIADVASILFGVGHNPDQNPGINYSARFYISPFIAATPLQSLHFAIAHESAIGGN